MEYIRLNKTHRHILLKTLIGKILQIVSMTNLNQKT